jgi:hypothetical protein
MGMSERIDPPSPKRARQDGTAETYRFVRKYCRDRARGPSGNAAILADTFILSPSGTVSVRDWTALRVSQQRCRHMAAYLKVCTARVSHCSGVDHQCRSAVG